MTERRFDKHLISSFIKFNYIYRTILYILFTRRILGHATTRKERPYDSLNCGVVAYTFFLYVVLLIQYVHLKFDIVKMILHLNNCYLGTMQQDVLKKTI
jgi:hypothetical protein